MQAVLHFFSATGNTARAVDLFAAWLQAAGWEVVRQPVAGRPAPVTTIPDLTVAAFPIRAWKARTIPP
jgi:hypothetical protein